MAETGLDYLPQDVDNSIGMHSISALHSH